MFIQIVYKLQYKCYNDGETPRREKNTNNFDGQPLSVKSEQSASFLINEMKIEEKTSAPALVG